MNKTTMYHCKSIIRVFPDSYQVGNVVNKSLYGEEQNNSAKKKLPIESRTSGSLL